MRVTFAIAAAIAPAALFCVCPRAAAAADAAQPAEPAPAAVSAPAASAAPAPAPAAPVPLVSELDRPGVVFGGYLDTYYLYDFNAAPGLDRVLANGALYATTGERSNEFNINLAYVEAKLGSDRVRGRFALQAGTSVQANYRAESAGLGQIQGAFPAELIQEAFAGYRIANGLWVDAGIFFSHLGFESFVSRDNWVYTRSLVAELSPYYESGAKLSYQIDPRWSAMLLVLNGWQNIYAVDTAKALGAQLSFAPSERFEINYDDFVGWMPGGLLRFYNEVTARYTLGAWQLALTLDEGTQARAGGQGTSLWYGGALLARWQVTPLLALGGRLERFYDPDGVVVQTGTPGGFSVDGGSVNADLQLHKNLLWRTEARLLLSDGDDVFGSLNGPAASDKFLVTSLALSF